MEKELFNDLQQSMKEAGAIATGEALASRRFASPLAGQNLEEVFRPLVSKFVAGTSGRYRQHCSDEMLTVLLVHCLGRPHDQASGKTVAAAILEGDRNAAYNAARWLFEDILERECLAGGNGHHVAQEFAAVMRKSAEDLSREFRL